MFAFKAKDGLCPECIALGRKWYIQDRHCYGDTYEYCLMSVTLEQQPVYRFKDLAEIAAWLNDLTDYQEKDSWWVGHMIRRWTVADYDDKALIEKNGIQFQLDKTKHTLTVLPKSRQETVWYDKYRDCLAEAKKLIEEEMNAQTGSEAA